MRKILFAVAIIVVVILIALTVNYFRNKPASGEATVFSNQNFAAESAAGDVQPTETPTDEPTSEEFVPTNLVTEWFFQGFTGETLLKSGFAYKWAIFTNAKGQSIRAICTMPRNPAPLVGDLFFLDPTRQILFSKNEYDNQNGVIVPNTTDLGSNAIQRFWPSWKLQ